jgi:heme a synthase
VASEVDADFFSVSCQEIEMHLQQLLFIPGPPISTQRRPLMLPTSAFARALRNAAPKLSRRFFDCRHCQSSTSQLAKTSMRNVPSPVRPQSNAAWTSRRFASTLVSPDVVQTVQSQTKKASSFPETSSNAVAYWLLGSAASVFGIVVFGGWTRLTESG